MRRSIQSRSRLTAAFALALSSISLSAGVLRGDPSTLDVDVGKPGAAIAPEFFGLMTEEINHSYDGGLFAELVQNRTFQDPGPSKDGAPIHWSVVGGGKVATDRADPVNAALPISLRLDLGGGEAGIANDGYWGIPVRPDTTYTVTFYARGGGGFGGVVSASLRTEDGDVVVAKADTAAITGAWQKYTVTLKTGHDVQTTSKARFVLSATGNGSVSFSLVSLFPPTYQDTPNGLRPDLMKLMADMHPKFIRLPGGNYVEGGRFSDRFNWKKMIGPADQRPGHMGCWSYRSSDGFGMPEYLLWCKQLNAEPVLAVFAGYTLNHDHFDAGSEEMAIYTREALEEIEYITGPADSKWGKLRAADGFPEPFPLQYVEIGNEDWFDGSGSYDGRFTEMAKAIREKYPQLKLIATAPVTSFKPDLYDDHFYRSPARLREMSNWYDPRTNPAEPLKYEGGGWSGRQAEGIKTFVGEWAAQEAKPITNMNSALADAAFVMGMERNADAVQMQCYAPLFANVNLPDTAKGYPRGWQWEYNLIGYDALRSFGSPSYYAQAMLSQNKGDIVLPTTFANLAVAPSAEKPHGSVGVGSWRTQVEYSDLTVTAADGKSLLAPGAIKDTKGWATAGGDWSVRQNVISPNSADSETWAVFGDPSWTDYSVRVRARKVGGSEGFIVLCHALGTSHYQWINIGGWDNTSAQFESANGGGGRDGLGARVPFQVETGRWYNLRLEVRGTRYRAFVDDQLITEASAEPQPTATPAYASATYVKTDNTVIVKVVNAGATALDTTINLRGVGHVEPNGTAIVLAGEPSAVNTLDEPLKVAPKQEAIDHASASFRHTFEAHSLTILKLKTADR